MPLVFCSLFSVCLGDVLRSIPISYSILILQGKKETRECYYCLSDFISQTKEDYIGMFAVSAGFGVDALCKK